MTDEQRKQLDELHSKICSSIMHQARIYASTLMMEIKFDARPEEAQAAGQLLQSMLEELSDLGKRAAVMFDETSATAQQLAQWMGEIAYARIKQEDPLPIIDKFINAHVKVMPPTAPSLH